MDKIQVLSDKGVDLWAVAEYLLLSEESIAGKQDSSWEIRWHKLLKSSGTSYVNEIFRNHLENSINSEIVLQFLERREAR